MSVPDDWIPFSKRALGSSTPYETLIPGVPVHLGPPLRRWLSDVLTPSLAERVNLRLRRTGGEPPEVELPTVRTDILLDVVDTVLSIGLNDEDLYSLHFILEDGGSAYQVAQNGTGLEHRVDPAVIQTYRAATTKANGIRPEAAKYLDLAWKHLYGLHPEPAAAYGEAVKAVEAAVIPVVIPTDQVPTLGKARNCLRDGESKWELTIAAMDGRPATVEPVVHMLSLLWQGHSDRHPGGPRAAPVTQGAAEAAVHLAATLVQWFVTGTVRRRDTSPEQPSAK